MTGRFRKRLVTLATAAVLFLLFYAASPAGACGPYFRSALFTRLPGFPPKQFAAGRLGILEPRLTHLQLYAAYYYLSGRRFSPGQQEALLVVWAGQAEHVYPRPAGETNWYGKWERARLVVPGVGQQPGESAQIYRRFSYWSYVNCNTSTFRTATETLRARIGKFGAASAEVRAWLDAQDRVLANCRYRAEAGPVLPQPAEPGLDPLIHADRAYQTAAAYFYAGKLEQAEAAFRGVARDAGSPWRIWAPYLAGRALLRRATLVEEWGKYDHEAMTRAAAQFQSVLDDPALSEVHPAAKRLLRFARIRLSPQTVFENLAGILAEPAGAENFRQQLFDYDHLLDRNSGRDWMEAVRARSEFTDWVLAFRSRSAGAAAHAVRRWQETRALAWLVAAIAKVDAAHPGLEGLLAAAGAVPADSPAYLTLAYHAVRLQLEAGRTGDARSRLDALLGLPASRLPLPLRNRFLAERIKLAEGFDEFLRLAPRVPVGESSWQDVYYPASKEAGRVRFFEPTTAALLNRYFPLERLAELIDREELPVNLRREIAAAAFTRALILGRHRVAGEIAPKLSVLVPPLAQLVSEYAEASSLPARPRRSSALYLLLRAPGLNVSIPAGFPREGGVLQRSNFRDNWWCDPSLRSPPVPQPPFLSPDQLAEAEREWETLKENSPGKVFLLREVVEWAKASPADPRVPEALHRAVQAGRYGCGPGEGKYARAAFELLHREYPDSPWTKKTPYWFD